jgi:hypothetical protein
MSEAEDQDTGPRAVVEELSSCCAHVGPLRQQLDAARADLAAANARADRTERMHEEDCQENDILRARIDKALALADEWDSTSPSDSISHSTRSAHIAIDQCAKFLRAALSEEA